MVRVMYMMSNYMKTIWCFLFCVIAFSCIEGAEGSRVDNVIVPLSSIFGTLNVLSAIQERHPDEDIRRAMSNEEARARITAHQMRAEA